MAPHYADHWAGPEDQQVVTDVGQSADFSLPTQSTSYVDMFAMPLTSDASASSSRIDGAMILRLPAHANVTLYYSADDRFIANINAVIPDVQQNMAQSRGTYSWTRAPGGPVLALTISVDEGALTIE